MPTTNRKHTLPDQAQGQQQPDALLAALPAVAASTRDAQRAVRGSALVALAAALGALGTRVLPRLGETVDALLAAADSAIAGLPEEGERAAPITAAPGVRKERMRSLLINVCVVMRASS